MKTVQSQEKKPRYQTISNREEFFPHSGEQNNLPSKTVPDQTLTMQEILTRYARGLPISNGKQPIYHGEEEMPDFRTMDLVEIQEYKEEVQARIQEYKNDLENKTKKLANDQKAYIAELEGRLNKADKAKEFVVPKQPTETSE